MRYLLVGLIILSLFFQNLGKTLIVASYISNQKFIAMSLCENRAKPEMHCNGKCHLRKQIQKEEQHNPKLPEMLKSYDEFAAVEGEESGFLFYFPASSETLFSRPSGASELVFIPSVFHPPAC